MERLCGGIPDRISTNVDHETIFDITDPQLNTSSNSLKILSLNCQSVISKKEVFWELLENYSPDVVVACETWLNQSIANNEFISPDYKIYRLDRDDGYGGIFIAVKSNISS